MEHLNSNKLQKISSYLNESLSSIKYQYFYNDVDNLDDLKNILSSTYSNNSKKKSVYDYSVSSRDSLVCISNKGSNFFVSFFNDDVLTIYSINKKFVAINDSPMILSLFVDYLDDDNKFFKLALTKEMSLLDAFNLLNSKYNTNLPVDAPIYLISYFNHYYDLHEDDKKTKVDIHKLYKIIKGLDLLEYEYGSDYISDYISSHKDFIKDFILPKVKKLDMGDIYDLSSEYHKTIEKYYLLKYDDSWK